MAILIEKLYQKFIPNGKGGIWYSLVKCERCNIERRALRGNVKKGVGAYLCGHCSQIGKKISKKTREKLRLANLGKKMSVESSEKKRICMLGEKNHFYGKTHTLKTKNKIAKLATGRISSSLGKKRTNLENFARGKNHYAWNENKKNEDRIQRTYDSQFVLWSRQIKRRDEYICQITGIKGGRLVSHHLNSWQDFPEQRYDLNNGITISESLHELFHIIYSKKHNTKEQFEEFETYINGVLFE